MAQIGDFKISCPVFSGTGIYRQMQEMDDMTLLREYATRNSEAAFAELVSRRVSFVYSAALRQVRNPHLAEEITQAVFIILAQKAGRISDKTILPGWLFKTTRFAATAQTRARVKRQQREQEAHMQTELQSIAPDPLWEQLSPLLDEALATLGETDRQAVLLRFFENKSLAEVGNTLGTGEDTARKRVSRALEKLRKFFSKRGVASTTTIIAGAISANSVQAAPAAVAKSVTAVAIAKGVAASGSTLTLSKGALKLMAWTKAKTAVVTVVLGLLAAAGTATLVVKNHIKARQYVTAHEPWSDVGSATPKSTLQSLLWALSNENWDRAQQLMQWDEKGTPASPFSLEDYQKLVLQTLASNTKQLASFRILSITPAAQRNEFIVKLEKSFKDSRIVPFSVTAKLRRVGDQWRAVGQVEYFAGYNMSTLLPFTGSF